MIDKVTVMNEARRKYRLEHEAEIKRQARVFFEQYKDDPLFVAGIMLYWAEGTRPAKYRKYQLSLVNSDPELLRVYCDFLRKYFDNVESGLRGALYIYHDIDEHDVKLFWSNYLKISINQFIKTQVLPSRSMLTKNKLFYGTCCVYLNSKDYCDIMQTWIEEISNAMRG